MAAFLYRPHRLGDGGTGVGWLRRLSPCLTGLLAATLLAALGGCAEFDYRSSYGGEGDPPAVYRVQSGDTLYRIAWRYGLDFRRVARWNGLESPYTIYPGQRLSLRPTARRDATDTTDRADGGSGASPAAEAAGGGSRQERGKGPPVTASIDRWQWPLPGAVLRGYQAGASGRRGITIGGDAGAQVTAAAAGRVVYSGNGLRGYGRLVIVKHNEAYLTAYAFNRELLVEEGERVASGGPIGLAGNTPEGHRGIHFELRRNGKPVNPLEYLPAR